MSWLRESSESECYEGQDSYSATVGFRQGLVWYWGGAGRGYSYEEQSRWVNVSFWHEILQLFSCSCCWVLASQSIFSTYYSCLFFSYQSLSRNYSIFYLGVICLMRAFIYLIYPSIFLILTLYSLRIEAILILVASMSPFRSQTWLCWQISVFMILSFSLRCFCSRAYIFMASSFIRLCLVASILSSFCSMICKASSCSISCTLGCPRMPSWKHSAIYLSSRALRCASALAFRSRRSRSTSALSSPVCSLTKRAPSQFSSSSPCQYSSSACACMRAHSASNSAWAWACNQGSNYFLRDYSIWGKGKGYFREEFGDDGVQGLVMVGGGELQHRFKFQIGSQVRLYMKKGGVIMTRLR